MRFMYGLTEKEAYREWRSEVAARECGLVGEEPAETSTVCACGWMLFKKPTVHCLNPKCKNFQKPRFDFKGD